VNKKIKFCRINMGREKIERGVRKGEKTEYDLADFNVKTRHKSENRTKNESRKIWMSDWERGRRMSVSDE